MNINNAALKAQVAELITNIPDEQLEHFALTIEAVAHCYQSQALHAVLLVQNKVVQRILRNLTGEQPVLQFVLESANQ